MTARFIISTAKQFNFRQTVFSHGWVMLSPFEWDEERQILRYIWRSAAGDVLRLCISATEGSVLVALPDLTQLGAGLRDQIKAVVRTILNLEWDLREFYTAMAGFPGYDWLEAECHGRILTSASLWEDLVKVLLTTGYRKLHLGANHRHEPPRLPTRTSSSRPRSANGRRSCFPDRGHDRRPGFPPDLAAAVRAGYRNAYLHELAQRVAERRS